MDPFATLGLPRLYRLDMRQLEANYRELQRVLHPDRHAGASASQRRMNLLKAVEVNEAYRALKNDLSRAEALLALQSGGAARSSAAEDPEFLMEMLELREALGDAHARADRAQVRSYAERIDRSTEQARAQLTAAFEALPQGPDAAQLGEVAKLLGRLKYFQRLRDEATALETAGEG